MRRSLRRTCVLFSVMLSWTLACGSAPDATALPPERHTDGGLNSDGAVPNDASDAKKDSSTSCVPVLCTSEGAQCGTIPDGCGGVESCGDCASGLSCGGSGPNRCGSKLCTPQTCSTLIDACGLVSDGCSATIDCGACTAPKTCGGGGEPGRCGCPKPTCASLGFDCGSASDGCLGTIECGACQAPKTCGGSGQHNRCGCTNPCAGLGANCGVVPDGCGGNVDCGSCQVPQTCAGGGQAHVCGCAPFGCDGKYCGAVADGCGGTLSCSCGSGQVCHNGNCCSPNCSGASCGESDGCGSNCSGSCPWSETCNSQHQCECGPSPHFKWVDGKCKASCGKWLGHMGYSNAGGGCCPSGCRSGVNGSSLDETHDCGYCCESISGQVSCN